MTQSIEGPSIQNSPILLAARGGGEPGDEDDRGRTATSGRDFAVIAPRDASHRSVSQSRFDTDDTNFSIRDMSAIQTKLSFVSFATG